MTRTALQIVAAMYDAERAEPGCGYEPITSLAEIRIETR